MLRSASAVSHLFKVAAGTDSMVVGDVQILNQIKDGFKIALEQKTIGLFLNRLVQSAFHVGKRARTESGINEGAVSISYAAVELATKIFASLSKKSALLVGAGETGELTARHLAGKGIGKLFIANRTRSRAEHLTASLGGTVVDFEQLATTMTEVDIVITSIESTHHIITAGQLSDVMKKRSHKPLCIIDIGVPRNIEPSANLIENIFLYDLDTLSKIIDQNLKKRELEVPLVNAIILEEIRAFQAWYSSLEINPTITDLHRRFEDIRQTEVTKHVNRFSSESDKELLELVTKRIIHKLLHVPTTTLRNGHGEPDDVKRKKIDFLRVLFGLTKEERENS